MVVTLSLTKGLVKRPCAIAFKEQRKYNLRVRALMQTYLKTKQVWIQLFLFLGMAFGILMVFFMIGGLILTRLTGINMMDLGNSANWKAGDPALRTALRGMILLQFLGLFLIPSLLFGYFSDPQP